VSFLLTGGTRVGARLLPKAGSVIAGLWRGGGAATRTVVGVGAGAVVADALLVPAVERVTGQDIQVGGVDLGTLTQDALAGIARQTSQTLGQAQAEASRGFAEGSLTGLLGLGEGQSTQIVTLAILGIGAVMLFKLVTD